MPHIPVLLEETLSGLNLKPGATYVDGTLGSGGHAAAVFNKLKGKVTIIGFDRDSDAIQRSKKLLSSLGAKPVLIQDSFSSMDEQIHAKGIKTVDAVLLDIGISSVQLDDSGRGFTFQKDEPLQMTMEANPNSETLTAKDLVNTSYEEALADIIFAYGEEKFARRIAKAIVEQRKIKPIETTFDLVSVVSEAVPGWYKKGKTNPATKTFQALRIAVNDELRALTKGIESAYKILAPGGRLLVITFHSLEDRIVKNLFREYQKEHGGILITKKPIVPSKEETRNNPRARSAKLRIIEKSHDRT